jgi:hypothetical protein
MGIAVAKLLPLVPCARDEDHPPYPISHPANASQGPVPLMTIRST